ncbi:MAG: hypothetical protein Fur0023_16370 [Bacteroidia bacterium]
MNEHLKNHFLNLCLLALSDEHMDTTEIEKLYQIGEEKGISKEEITEIILNPNQASDINMPQDVFTKVEYLYDFAQIIIADGVVDEREIKMMENFCNQFGFKQENIPSIIQFLIEEAKNNTPKHHVLEQVKEAL